MLCEFFIEQIAPTSARSLAALLILLKSRMKLNGEWKQCGLQWCVHGALHRIRVFGGIGRVVYSFYIVQLQMITDTT